MFCLCLLLAVWQIVSLAAAPLLTIVQHVPDDAFYYLAIARNLGVLGRSTFDGGQTLTTGYHPLWAWLVELFGRLVRFDRMDMLREMILLSGALSIAAAIAVARAAWKSATVALPVLTLLMTSFSFLNNSIAGMEWCLVLPISVAALWLFLRLDTHPATPRTLVLLAFLGVLGSLARSDFGGQTAGYLAAAVLLYLLRREVRYLGPSLAFAVGAGAGLALAALHDHAISGQWLQGSAHIKQLWGKSWGASPFPFLLVLGRSVFYIPALHKSIAENLRHNSPAVAAAHPHTLALRIAAVAVLCAFVALLWRLGPAVTSRMVLVSSRNVFFFAAACVTLAVYTVVYSLNSLAMQAWYTADVTVAVGILLVLAMASARQHGFGPAACALLAVATLGNVVLFLTVKPISYMQEEIVGDAQAVHALLGDSASIGISDTGIFNFVYGGRVINLDGLMNDEIAPYAPHRLPCYLADKHIEFTNGFGRAATVAFHVEPITDYATPVATSTAQGLSVILYRVDFAKIRALPECAR